MSILLIFAGMNIMDIKKTGRANKTWFNIYTNETVSQQRNFGLFIVWFE